MAVAAPDRLHYTPNDDANELIPQLSGWAFITGEHRFRIDSRDPLRHGFQLA